MSHRPGRRPRQYVGPSEKAARQAKSDAWYRQRQPISPAANPGTAAGGGSCFGNAGTPAETPRTGGGATR